MLFTSKYPIPVEGDKVFRSRKYGQVELINMTGIKRIFVESRDDSFTNEKGVELVWVIITADTEADFISCCSKGRDMILKILHKSPPKVANNGSYRGVYKVKVEADKVFRSPKHGQKTLRENHPNCKIQVCGRIEGQSMVKVFIIGRSKYETDACWREGDQLVKKLLESLPKSERADPSKDLTIEEKEEDFIKRVKNLIFSREILGFETHDDSIDVQKLITIRETNGIMEHSELGQAWRPIRKEVLLDDIIGYEVPIDNWGDHAEIWQKAQLENPDLTIVS